MSESLISELIVTIMIMLKSKSREAIKAALGFVKVIVVTVEQEHLAKHIEIMVKLKVIVFSILILLDRLHQFFPTHVPTHPISKQRSVTSLKDLSENSAMKLLKDSYQKKTRS